MWNRVTGFTPAFGVYQALDTQIAELHSRTPDALPHLSSGRLVAASDYSGAHVGSAHDVLGLLITTETSVQSWNVLRENVRQAYRLPTRRISYTKLNDRQKVAALGPFLHAANSLEGLLCCVAISKQLASIFDAKDTAYARESQLDSWRFWKPTTFERMLRITSLLTLLVCGLIEPGQRLIWITDQDEIAGNIKQQTELTRVVANMLNKRVPGGVSEIECWTTGIGNRKLQFEDLAALPDLAGGALCDLFSSYARRNVHLANDVNLPVPSDLSGKALQVLYWLRERPRPLRRLVFKIDKGAKVGDVTVSAPVLLN
jgi:hypothetical protein